MRMAFSVRSAGVLNRENVNNLCVLNPAETHFEWQRDVISEYERPRAGAAFAAINRDEVDPARTTCHQARQVLPERRIAYGGFDPNG